MTPRGFSPIQRLLHWLMAVMILAMLFVGIGMVATLKPVYGDLVALHRPLGIAILVLALLRLGMRLRRGAPALPADLPWWQAATAKASHLLLYALMIAMPVIGWGMLSAGSYPNVLHAAWHLPSILPPDDGLQALLRRAHHWLALVFFATILLHIAAALFHGLSRRDGVFSSMIRPPRG